MAGKSGSFDLGDALLLAQAQTRLIVRDSLGLPGINLTCLLTGCQVVTGLGDPNGQLFLVTFPPFLNPVTHCSS